MDSQKHNSRIYPDAIHSQSQLCPDGDHIQFDLPEVAEGSEEPVLSQESVFAEISVMTGESVSSQESVITGESGSSVALYPKKTLGEKIKGREEALAKLKRNPRILSLYKSYIEKRFTPSQGKRNSDLLEMVTFLFRAVGAETLMALVAAFYDLNQEIFHDSREQHMAEATAHLKACNKSWFEELPIEQRECLSDLPEPYQEAFRICRDLSSLEDKRRPRGFFFLSYCELALRIGTTQKEAARILHTFDSEGWLEIHTMGTQHQPGAKGKATLYHWLLPVAVATVIVLLPIPLIFYNCPIQPMSTKVLSHEVTRNPVPSSRFNS